MQHTNSNLTKWQHMLSHFSPRELQLVTEYFNSVLAANTAEQQRILSAATYAEKCKLYALIQAVKEARSE